MDGMRFVIGLNAAKNALDDLRAYVPVPCDCQLVGIIATGNGGTDQVTVGYIAPDGNQDHVDEGICWGPLAVKDSRYWDYTEFEGSAHDGTSPFRCPAGSQVVVRAEGR